LDSLMPVSWRGGRIAAGRPTHAALPERRGLLRSLLSGLVLFAVPRMVRAQDQSPPSAPATMATDLATRNNGGNLLTVPVEIEGKGPFQFVVDTGAERSLIAESIATMLHLDRGTRINLVGLTRNVSANVVKVHTLTYGVFTRTDLEIPVLSRAALEADGFLGLDVIRNSRVVFDFKSHRLKIERPGDFPADDPSIQTVVVRAHGAGGRLRMSDCSVDGVGTVAFVDTGAEVSVCNMALFRALVKRNPSAGNMGLVRLIGVTGGEVSAQIVPARQIVLQSLIFSGGTLAAADVDDFSLWGLMERPALLIGMDYLRQFSSVAIDYRNHEVKFEMSINDTRDIAGAPAPGANVPAAS
jgi:predicted aspartyl protease